MIDLYCKWLTDFGNKRYFYVLWFVLCTDIVAGEGGAFLRWAIEKPISWYFKLIIFGIPYALQVSLVVFPALYLICNLYNNLYRKDVVMFCKGIVCKIGVWEATVISSFSLIQLFCVLTAKTIFPASNIGMFEESVYSDYNERITVICPRMIVHMENGEKRVASIRAASLPYKKTLKLSANPYLAMIYFKYRHNQSVRSVLLKAAERSELKEVAFQDVGYKLTPKLSFVEVNGIRIPSSENVLDGRRYILDE